MIWDDLREDATFRSSVEDAIRGRIQSISDTTEVPTGGQESVSLSGATGIDFEFGPPSADDLVISVELIGQALAVAAWIDGGNDGAAEEREVEVQLAGFISFTFPSDFLVLAMKDVVAQVEIGTDDVVVTFDLEVEDLDDYDEEGGK